jgi:hypothetical protein
MNLTNELITSFILGGIILSSITYVSKHVSIEMASIIWAAPVLLIPSILILWQNKEKNSNIIDFVNISILYVFITILWMILFIKISKKNINHQYCVIKSILFSSIIWCFIVTILYKINIINYFNY